MMNSDNMHYISIGFFVAGFLFFVGIFIYTVGYANGQTDCLTWPDRCTEMVNGD